MAVAPSTNGMQPVNYMQQTVDPNSLVSNQLSGLLSSNSPYINQAIAQSQAQSAGRGLLNSSIAGGAGENAAISAAVPIAAANAQEYAAVGAANQQAATAIQGANIQKSATLGAANIQASVQKMEANQQFQEYGMGLGYQYAQLGQQGQQFSQQMAQNATQFTQSQNTAIAQFQSQQSFAQYQLGVQQQMSNQQNYATMFSNIMMNPNMTADERSAALGNAQSYFTQQSQYNATLPAFVPPYVSNPDYWSSDFTAPASS